MTIASNKLTSIIAESERTAAISMTYLTDTDIHEMAVRYTYMQNLIHATPFPREDLEYLCNRHLKPESMSPRDAAALRNIYKTFVRVCSLIREYGSVTINTEFIKSLHSSLAKDLIVPEHQGRIRDYTVSMGEYTPPFDPKETEAVLNNLIVESESIDSPTLKAIHLHLNIINIQPFGDLNKRTARMVETAVLLNAGIAPIIVNDPEEIIALNEAKKAFFKTGDYSKYAMYIAMKRISA